MRATITAACFIAMTTTAIGQPSQQVRTYANVLLSAAACGLVLDDNAETVFRVLNITDEASERRAFYELGRFMTMISKPVSQFFSTSAPNDMQCEMTKKDANDLGIRYTQR